MKQKIIQQGAEAKIMLEKSLEKSTIIKDRTKKSYRISEIDNAVRKRRTKSETKLLEKASKIISTPKPEKLNSKEFDKIKMPFVEGEKLSQELNNLPLKDQKQIMGEVGKSVALLHKNDIIHGDLTTSNMILKNTGPSKNKEVFLIDFGLGYISKKVEDKAVDLHLLQQALEAKHFKNWKELFEEFSKAYEKILGPKESKKIFERIKAIEKRGRYRH